MTTLITGANRGIGLALARHLSKAGEKVIATHRGTSPPAEGFEWQQLDVAVPDSHKQLADKLKDQPLNVLVCNAGVYLEKSDTLSVGYAAAKWAETFAVNVTGVFQTIQYLLPNLRLAGGKIAIISSNMGSDARAPGGSYIYRASKAAVLNLGRNLAMDLRRDLIPVGIYHPGWVRTDMGTSGAEISVDESASGLIKRFAALDLPTTGRFESWDGKQLQF